MLQHCFQILEMLLLYGPCDENIKHEGIILKKSKCSVEYLGHCIDGEGLHTTDKKVKAVQQAPQALQPTAAQIIPWTGAILWKICIELGYPAQPSPLTPPQECQVVLDREM